MTCVDDVRKTFPQLNEFKLIDLDYDVDFFGVTPFEPLIQAVEEYSGRVSLITERQNILRQWKEFARQNKLMLAWNVDNLIHRAQLVTERNGGCPGIHQERKCCPCTECIQECKEKGECSCRIFLASDWEERRRRH